MESNRLIFTTVDTSVSTTQSSNKTGLTVVKAPKGTSTPIFFSKNSSDAIQSVIGSPSSTYPGIREAIEFNQNYGLWISAPEGAKTSYSNYYGGVYFIAPGIIKPFYQVTDPTTPNFLTEAFCAGTSLLESTYNGSGVITSTAQATVTGASPNTVITTSNVPTAYFTKYTPLYVNLYYPGNGTTVPSAGRVSLKCVANGPDWILKTPTNNIVVGSITTSTATIQITGTTTNQSDPEVMVVGWNFNAALNTYIKSGTGGAFTDKLSGVPGATLSWVLQTQTDTLMTLYQTSPRSNVTTLTVTDVNVLVSPNNLLFNSVTFSMSETAYSNVIRTQTFTVSPDVNAVDGYNSSLYVENVLSGNYFINGLSYGNFTRTSGSSPGYDPWELINGLTGATPFIISPYGSRVMDAIVSTNDSASLITSLLSGWTASSTSLFSDVSIFFNPELTMGDFQIATQMGNMRTSTFKRATYIAGLRVAASDAITAMSQYVTARSSLPKITGLAFYINEFLVQTGSTKFWTVPIGSVATMLCQIMDIKRGGAAPMWVNTSDGLGGQINTSVLKAKYDFTADQLDTLDLTLGLNPIIKDNTYGLMITSQRTAQDPLMLTDWSKLGHQMSFDLFMKDVKTNVMTPQIGKPINADYMRLRKRQTQDILSLRLSGPTAIWDSGKVLVEEVNTDITRAANTFVIKVRVKVNPFAEYVELIFQNVSQSDTV